MPPTLDQMNNESVNPDDSPLMQVQKIALADGRYMIFYTFAASLPTSTANTAVESPSMPHSETEEEKNV